MSEPSVDSSGRQVPPEDLHRALAGEPRRRVLDYFEGATDGTASLDELADYVRARRNGSETRSPEETRVRLRHVDLPKLAAIDAIDYDAETNTVRHRGLPGLERAEDGWDVVPGDHGDE